MKKRKLKLKLDDLEVDSFETDSEWSNRGIGTVFGHGSTIYHWCSPHSYVRVTACGPTCLPIDPRC